MDHINQLHEHLPMLQDRRTEIIQRIHERCIIVDYGAVIGGHTFYVPPVDRPNLWYRQGRRLWPNESER